MTPVLITKHIIQVDLCTSILTWVLTLKIWSSITRSMTCCSRHEKWKKKINNDPLILFLIRTTSFRSTYIKINYKTHIVFNNVFLLNASFSLFFGNISTENVKCDKTGETGSDNGMIQWEEHVHLTKVLSIYTEITWKSRFKNYIKVSTSCDQCVFLTI